MTPMKGKWIVRNCRHRMPTGATCHAPAMRDSAYCYHHAPLHRSPRGHRRLKDSLRVARLDTGQLIVNGVGDIINAILADKIDSRNAGKLLYGMQIASDMLIGGARLTRNTACAPANVCKPSASSVPDLSPPGQSAKSDDLPYYKS
jgi:hypothetical protein